MLSRTIVFLILTLFIFSSLVLFLPVAFRASGTSAQDPAVVEILNANDLIVYSIQVSDNMTYGYSSLEDAPDAPQWNVGLPEDEYIEVWWDYIPYYGGYVINLNHVRRWWSGWQIVDICFVYFKSGIMIPNNGHAITKDVLISAWDSDTKSSPFTAQSGDISYSIVFRPAGGYDTIVESWDAGKLYYGLSYEWNEEASGFNILAVLAKVITFQGLGLGIPGIFGDFIDSIISMFFWIGIAFITYKIFAGLIPLLSGGSGD